MSLASGELDQLGHALSRVVQQRFVWLFNHAARAITLSVRDGPLAHTYVPQWYQFSDEDARAGIKPINVYWMLNRMALGGEPFAESADGAEKFDGAWAREMTLTGMRKGLLLSTQAYLEVHGVERIFRTHSLALM